MKKVRADLHIHTVLSPCGDLAMSPRFIIEAAIEKKIDIIGITDHNTTRQCKVVEKLGAKSNILVLCGAEVTTKEEAHVLVFFKDHESLDAFQTFLDNRLPNIPNNERLFGYQVAVDDVDNIVYTEKKLLISAIEAGISEVREVVASLGGLFIPAHVDKSRFSLFSQLGVYDPRLNVDAFEISPFGDKEQIYNRHQLDSSLPAIYGSDAHYPHEIGRRMTELMVENISFSDIAEAIRDKVVNRINLV